MESIRFSHSLDQFWQPKAHEFGLLNPTGDLPSSLFLLLDFGSISVTCFCRANYSGNSYHVPECLSTHFTGCVRFSSLGVPASFRCPNICLVEIHSLSYDSTTHILHFHQCLSHFWLLEGDSETCFSNFILIPCWRPSASLESLTHQIFSCSRKQPEGKFKWN